MNGVWLVKYQQCRARFPILSIRSGELSCCHINRIMQVSHEDEFYNTVLGIYYQYFYILAPYFKSSLDHTGSPTQVNSLPPMEQQNWLRTTGLEYK